MGERVNVLMYKDKEIIYVDLSNFNLRTKKELVDNLEKAKKLISGKPPKSVFAITDVSNTAFDKDLTNVFKEYTAHNTTYVKASALVGISGLQKVLLSVVKTVTGRSFYLADSADEAKEWLARQ